MIEWIARIVFIIGWMVTMDKYYGFMWLLWEIMIELQHLNKKIK